MRIYQGPSPCSQVIVRPLLQIRSTAIIHGAVPFFIRPLQSVRLSVGAKDLVNVGQDV